MYHKEMNQEASCTGTRPRVVQGNLKKKLP